jgi:hypothetical protein
MKIIRYIDVGIQTILFVWLIIILIGTRDGLVTNVLFVQLCMGAYQMASSGVSIVAALPFPPPKKVLHITISIVYLISLSGLFGGNEKLFFKLYLLIPSWSLAIYYYIVSLGPIFWRPKRGKFLPHLGF